MAYLRRTRVSLLSIIAALGIAAESASLAMDAPDPKGRFDALVVSDPAELFEVATTSAAALPSKARAGWDVFRSAHGQEWSMWIDRSSGAPLLVEGKGIPWPIDAGATVESIAASLRPFISAHRSILMANDAELVLDRDASGTLLPDVWQIVFARVIGGVPVTGERYLFTIGHGRLISFGASRWSHVDVDTTPRVDEAGARSRLLAYMKVAKDEVEDVVPPRLEIEPLRSGSALIWRFSLRAAGELGVWVAGVDAHTGAIRSFADDTKYARLKGGVYPTSDDQTCPNGCEQPNYPIPFATVTINATTPTTTTNGMFTCSPAGATATTNLTGPYIEIEDSCGAISESVTCSNDIDLGVTPGANCNVQPGSSLGNTYAARTSFYHLNRAAEHARTWLSRLWLTNPLTARVNFPQDCLGAWEGGEVFFGWSNGPCHDGGANIGNIYHEWGHGLDQNDGGDYDVPTEAYADVTAILASRDSCVFRGLTLPSFGPCGPAGNPCTTSCYGGRDLDWNAHALHTPATVTSWAVPFCQLSAGYHGPCGYGQHCEGQIAGETMWDLAVRDLPSTGMSLTSSWQLVDRLWYTSRLGSGGNAYNCSPPDSDGCSVTSWFSKLRAVDDDDGNLANGTPHAAQIFAAFNRHKIACGAAGDPSNQSTATCPVIPGPTLAVASRPGSVFLSWNAVPNATSYRILRSDLGCSFAMTRVNDVASTSFTNIGLANGFPLYYAIQGLSGNAACDGAVSNCVAVTPQQFAGALSVDASTYACSAAVITVTVVDGNAGTATSATLSSTTETGPETIPLPRIAPGSNTYRNTITTTTAAPAADGLLSVRNGDTITVTYIDANDGAGVNVPRVTTATATCVTPGVRPVPDGSFGIAMKASRTDGTGTAINLKWDVATCSSTDHHLLYGNLATVSSITIGGGACNLGTSGTAIWAGVPPGNVWFTIVGDDDATTEGSWGTTSSGAQRGGATVSGQCGMTARDNSGSCP